MKWRSTELYSMLTVLMVPLGLALVFPYEAVVPIAWKSSADCAPSAAFVRLSDADERMALRTVKTSWQANTSGTRRLRPDLATAVLPEEPLFSEINLDVGPTSGNLPSVGYALSAPPQTLAAPAPAKLPSEVPTREGAAFSRDELLELK